MEQAMDTAMVRPVIVTTLLRRGDGTAESPIRIVTQYWDRDGTLLAENDSFSESQAAVRKLRADLNDAVRQLAKQSRDLDSCERRLLALGQAVKWALGENGEFKPRPSKGGSFWWREELRRRAGM